MDEEDVLLDEQVKKKKRFILLGLLSLLLALAATLPWLGAPSPPATAIAEAGSKTATASPPAATPEGQSPPEDETPPARPTGSDSRPRPSPSAPASPVPATPTALAFTATPAAQITGPSDTAVPVATTPSTETAGRKTPLVITPPSESPGDEASELDSPPAGQVGEPAAAATSTSPRYDGPEMPDPTHTAATSSSKATTAPPGQADIPPDGLPVTGASRRPGSNWAALGMAILLLGAGAASLFRFKREEK